MPSMLGLTTDESPHAMSGQRQDGASKRNGSTALTTRPSGAVSAPTNKPRFDSASKKKDNGGGRKNTIHSRNQAAGHEMETLIWRALCDDPGSAMEYIADDAVMVNPLFFDDASAKSKDSEPTLKDALMNSAPYLGYKMHDPTVVEIDLMALTIVYTVTVYRPTQGTEHGEGRFEAVEATASSSWRQVAGGDWEMVSMHVAYAQ